MNEKKQEYNQYLRSKELAQKRNSSDIDAQMLAGEIRSFMNNLVSQPSDWIILDKMQKQLYKQKFNVPRKVLTSMQSKFESIQSKYQR